jgi:tetratricopeptide (TPR) repeat protein
LEKAAKFNPTMPCLHQLRARAYNDLGEYEKALTHLGEYVKVFGESAQTYRDRGVALAGLGRREEAVTAFQKASAEDPRAVNALLTEQPRPETLPLWEVEVKWSAGDYEAVVRLLNANRKDIFAQKTAPALQERMRDHLVRSLVRLQRFDEARKEAEELGWEKAPLLYALAYVAAGDEGKATDALARCDKQGRTAVDYHADPDLGPLLRVGRIPALSRKYDLSSP